MFDPPTMVYKPQYNCFQFNDNSADMKQHIADEHTRITDGIVPIFLPNSKVNEVRADAIPKGTQNKQLLRNKRRVNRFDLLNDSVNEKDSLSQNANDPGESDVFSIDDELPELAVFIQESSYQFHKDICIDKRVTFQEKRLENSAVAIDSESMEETEDTVSSNSSDSGPIVEQDCIRDVNKRQCTSNNMLTKSKKHFSAERHEVVLDHSVKKIVPVTPLLDSEVPSKETVSTTSRTLSSTKLVDRKSDTSKSTAKNEIEAGSIFRDFESSVMKKSHGRVAADFQHPLQTENTSRLENETLEIKTELSHSFVTQSAGTLPHCGSISFRSSGSASSSGSFAFPILDSEWNGSPVRMFNSGQTEMKRIGRWRMRFLCCKF